MCLSVACLRLVAQRAAAKDFMFMMFMRRRRTSYYGLR